MPRIRKTKLQVGGKAKVIGMEDSWHAFEIGSIVIVESAGRDTDYLICQGINRRNGKECLQSVNVVDLQAI